MENLEIKYVIVSRGRSFIVSGSKKLFPSAIVCVPESEVEQYKNVINEKDVYGIPDNLIGLGAVRDYVLNHFKDEIIIMIDDDIKYFWCCIGATGKAIKDPAVIEEICRSCAQCAVDSGAKLFGLTEVPNVIYYRANKPFVLNKRIGSLIGCVGKDIKFDIELKFQPDVDAVLKELQKNRIVWVDERYSYCKFGNDHTVGGNSLFKTREAKTLEFEMLKKRYGKYINHRKTKTGNRLKINVQRTQNI